MAKATSITATARAHDPVQTRRAALGVMAGTALAAAAITAAVGVRSASGAESATDEIFAVIEAHRAAHHDWVSKLDRLSALEAQIPHDKRKWFCSVYDPLPPEGCTDDPRWTAEQLANDARSSAEGEARWALVATAPDTVAGALALLQYVREYYSANINDEFLDGADEFVPLLESVAECLAANSATATPRASGAS